MQADWLNNSNKIQFHRTFDVCSNTSLCKHAFHATYFVRFNFCGTRTIEVLSKEKNAAAPHNLSYKTAVGVWANSQMFTSSERGAAWSWNSSVNRGVWDDCYKKIQIAWVYLAPRTSFMQFHFSNYTFLSLELSIPHLAATPDVWVSASHCVDYMVGADLTNKLSVLIVTRPWSESVWLV